jgi:carbonic anhydrase
MQKLVQGIHRFQKDVFGSRKELFERLAHGQSPEALFITCSDSRINPNLLTQTEPGDLFIIRNAGNLIPAHGTGDISEEATIEFAVKALGVKDIIVCGHSHCGAVQGLLEPESLTDLPAMRHWLRHAEETSRIIQENYPHLEGEARLTATVEENVLVQLENLRSLPSVADKVAEGKLELHGWVYKLETGEVFAYDSSEGQFVPLSGIRFPPARHWPVSAERR